MKDFYVRVATIAFDAAVKHLVVKKDSNQENVAEMAIPDKIWDTLARKTGAIVKWSTGENICKSLLSEFKKRNHLC